MLLSQNYIARTPCVVGNVPHWPFKVELLRKFFLQLCRQTGMPAAWSLDQTALTFQPREQFLFTIPCLLYDCRWDRLTPESSRAQSCAQCHMQIRVFFLHPYCEIQPAVPTAFSWNQPSRLFTFAFGKFLWLSMQKNLSFKMLIHECNQRHSKKYLRHYF